MMELEDQQPIPEEPIARVSRPTQHQSRMKRTALVIFVLSLNVVAIGLAVVSIQSRESGGKCQGRSKASEVVGPLCVPCEDGWMGERSTGKEEVEEKEGGWRRYRGGELDLCCALNHGNLASAVGQIYRTVLHEKQQDFNNVPPRTYSAFRSFYTEPESTRETVIFANNNKPSAHVTGVQPYDPSKYFTAASNSSPDNSLQTVSDWPLRFEPYRSTTRGYVQKLTWGLVVPVSGLYRVHSTVNFYFSYTQDTKRRLQQGQRPLCVVHQLTRYRRAERQSTVLTQRNQTISSGYTDGLTSFLVTVQELEVGDVVSIDLSHQAAMAMRDRWHSQGLFLLQ